MEKITLQCPITVKAKVTEKFKKAVLEKLNHQMEQIQAEIAHIEQDMKKLLAQQDTNVDVQQVSIMLQQMEQEKQKRFSFLSQTKSQLAETEELAIGSEVVQGTMQHLLEVKVGDVMPEIMNTEILVEDGKIIAIRA